MTHHVKLEPPSLTPDDSNASISHVMEYAIAAYGGPAQYIRAILDARSCVDFTKWLKEELPPPEDVELIHADSVEASDNTVNATVWSFGFDIGSSTKPPPFAITCRQLASEMDKDGFITSSEPMRAFIRDSSTDTVFQLLGHVKGMARFAVLMAPLVWLWKLTPAQKVIDVFPLLFQTARVIRVVIESHSTVTAVALRNAQLSQRGSIRKAHDSITWVAKLNMLRDKSQDPSNVIKTYNLSASSNAQLNGMKRVAVLALMSVSKEALDVILDCVSLLGFDHCPWIDEAWSFKKAMPGFMPRLSTELWSRRLTITEASFLLMVKWQSNMQKKKLPQMRRKADRAAMEEAASVCALVQSLYKEMLSEYPVKPEDLETNFMQPFLLGKDSNLLVALQGLLHTKPASSLCELLPVFEELVHNHVQKSDISLTGVSKTELINAEIEETEFKLFEKKFSSDIDTRFVHMHKTRT